MLINDVPVDDIPQIFDRTFQFHTGIGWVYIIEARGGTSIVMYTDGTRKETVKIFSDKEFQIRAPNLGYVNAKGTVSYCSRLPKRIMKGGVTWDAVHIADVIHENTDMLLLLSSGIERLKYDLTDMFNNEYPTLQEAATLVTHPNCHVVAYDRQFAITKDGKILYRGNQNVGTYCSESNTVKLKPHYQCLSFSGGDYGTCLQIAKQAARKRISRVGD